MPAARARRRRVATAPVEPTPTVSVPTGLIGTDTSPVTARGRRRGTSQTTTQSDATARAKAAYDARPKVTFRSVDEDTAAKLRGIYKHQLHQPGVEGERMGPEHPAGCRRGLRAGPR